MLMAVANIDCYYLCKHDVFAISTSLYVSALYVVAHKHVYSCNGDTEVRRYPENEDIDVKFGYIIAQRPALRSMDKPSICALIISFCDDNNLSYQMASLPTFHAPSLIVVVQLKIRDVY